MDQGLFEALFKDENLNFKIDGKKLEASLEKYKGTGSASRAMFGGLDLFEGKIPANADDSAATMDDLREGGAGGPGGAGAPAGGRTGEMGDPKVEEEMKEDKVAGVASAEGGKKVNIAVTSGQGGEDVAGVTKDIGVKEGTAGVAKTPGEKETAGVAKAGTGDVKPSDIVKSHVKEEVGAEKVVGEFTDEQTAKELQARTQDSEISNYKNKEGNDVWKVTVMAKPGMAEKAEKKFNEAIKVYRKILSETINIKEEKDPLNAGLTALKSTIQNMLNFYAAGDMTQSVEYANLATKQAADIGANLQTMKAAEDAAKSVGNPMDPAAGGDMSATGGVSDAATATADSMPTGAGGEEALAGEEMSADSMEVPEEDVEVPEEQYNGYEKEYESIEEAHMGFKKLQKKIEGEGKSKETAAKIAASVGRKKFGKDKFQAMAKKGKNEGKIPTNTPDGSKETMDKLYEKKVQECAEKAYLVLKLKERKSLTEKEKAFIEAVQKEKIDEKLRADARVFLKKMVTKTK